MILSKAVQRGLSELSIKAEKDQIYFERTNGRPAICVQEHIQVSSSARSRFRSTASESFSGVQHFEAIRRKTFSTMSKVIGNFIELW